MLILLILSISLTTFFVILKGKAGTMNLQKIIYNDCRYFNPIRDNAREYFERSVNIQFNNNNFDMKKNVDYDKVSPDVSSPEKSAISDFKNISNVIDLESSNRSNSPERKSGEANLKANSSPLPASSVITKKDYESLSGSEAILYDKRGFCRFYGEFITESHPILRLFLNVSLRRPLIVKLSMLMLELSLFALFSCGVLDNRAVGFIYCWVITSFLSSLINLIIIVPYSTRESLNDSLKSQDTMRIEEGYQRYKSSMTCQHAVYMLISFIIQILAFIYVTAYCGVYYIGTEWVAYFLGNFIFYYIIILLILRPLFVSTMRFLSQITKSATLGSFAQILVRGKSFGY
jgi:hypothetical protein